MTASTDRKIAFRMRPAKVRGVPLDELAAEAGREWAIVADETGAVDLVRWNPAELRVVEENEP